MNLLLCTQNPAKQGTMVILPMPFDKTNNNNYKTQGIRMYSNVKVEGPVMYKYIGEETVKNLVDSDWSDSKSVDFDYEYYLAVNSIEIVNNTVYEVIDGDNVYRYQKAYAYLGLTKISGPTKVQVEWVMANY